MKQIKKNLYFIKNIKKILKKFRMKDYKPIGILIEYDIKLSKQDDGDMIDSTYFKNLVGSLKYLICMRLNILYRTGLVSGFIDEPKSAHIKIIKKILC